MVLHRWQYDWVWRVFRCVAASGGVGDPSRCLGCGDVVTEEDLYRFLGGQDPGLILSASLNYLCGETGGG